MCACLRHRVVLHVNLVPRFHSSDFKETKFFGFRNCVPLNGPLMVSSASAGGAVVVLLVLLVVFARGGGAFFPLLVARVRCCFSDLRVKIVHIHFTVLLLLLLLCRHRRRRRRRFPLRRHREEKKALSCFRSCFRLRSLCAPKTRRRVASWMRTK